MIYGVLDCPKSLKSLHSAEHAFLTTRLHEAELLVLIGQGYIS